VPISRAVALVRRHLLVLGLVFVLGVGGTAFELKQMPKQYTASATILIEPQRTQVSDLQAISPDPGDVASLVRTQIDILRSNRLVLGVVRSLDLVDNPEFHSRAGGLRGLLDRARHWASLGAGEVGPPRQDQREQLVAAILQGKIGFTNETRSSVLGVSVTTGNPRLSADIANAMARQFLDFKRNEKFAAMQRAHDWFQEQLGTLSEQVRAADLAAEAYRREHGLEEQPPDTGNTLTRTATTNRQQLDEISRQLTDVSRERALKEGQLAQAQAVMRGALPAAALPEVLSSASISQLLAQIAAVSGREAQLETAQGANNPELVATRAQFARLQARLQQEMANVAASLSTTVQAARAQEKSLRAQLDQLRAAVSDENSAEVGLQALQARARATRGIYESFLTRATQLANVAGIQEPDASLVSAAEPPLGPSSPKMMRMLGVSALLSLVLGVVVAVVIERLRPGFGVPEELETAVGLPMLAAMPRWGRAGRVRGDEARWKRSRPAITLEASFDMLRGQFRAMGETRPTVVMVTSALPREGKSVFAARLARNAARAGWRVMLVECDFRRPSIAAMFGLPPGPGLSQVLNGTLLGSEDAALHQPVSQLHVLPAGWVQGDPQELLASRRMEALLAAARERYDLVILDTPPVLPVPDALVLGARADATLMLVRWEKTPRAVVQDAVRILRESRARVMGTVMTRVNMRTAQIVGGRMSHALGYYDGYHTYAGGKARGVEPASSVSPR